MASAAPDQTNQVRFCWEQVLRTNRLFRISSAFASPASAEQLLPLHALFGAVEEICSKHSDEDVARRKLDWWRQECSRPDGRRSEHPILSELVRSGAWEALRKDSLARLFDDAESRLDPATPADLDGLQALCRDLSQPQFELELSLCGVQRQWPRHMEVIGAASGLAQLLREAARRPPSTGYWWLPLTLLARHGVSRAEIARDGNPGPAEQAVFADLLERSDSWASVPKQDRFATTEEASASRHLWVLGQLQVNALRRLRPGQARPFAAELTRLGLPQLYQAWRAARKVGSGGVKGHSEG